MTIVPTPINMGDSFLKRPPRGTELLTRLPDRPGELSDLCRSGARGRAGRQGRPGFTGKIFEAVPERAVLPERKAHLLGSCIIALYGG